MKTTITFDVNNIFEASALMALYRLMSDPVETGFLGLEELAGIEWAMMEIASTLMSVGRQGDRFGKVDPDEEATFDDLLDKIETHAGDILKHLTSESRQT